MLVNRKRLERIYADFWVAPKFFLCYPFIMFTEELVLMFVDISDYKSALAIENILTPYKKGRLAEDKKTSVRPFHKGMHAFFTFRTGLLYLM